jgi:hypothetical protein
MFEDVDMELIPGLGVSPQAQRNLENDVTVHHFTRGATPSPSSSALLETGRDTAEFAASTKGWYNVKPLAIRGEFYCGV